jgi:hypothetical protein
VVLHEAQGVGVVFGDHHFPGLAASQRDSGSYHNNYQSFHTDRNYYNYYN